MKLTPENCPKDVCPFDEMRPITPVIDFVEEIQKGGLAFAGTALAHATKLSWIALATGCYVSIQLVYLARRWWRQERTWKLKMRHFGKLR